MEPSRSYTPEFRAEAVKLVLEQGLSLSEAAERLLLPKGTLRTWVSKAKGGKAPMAPGARSVAELETEVRQLRKDKPVVNAMRKKISAEAPWREVLSHLLQGIEAKMLHTVMELYVEEIWLLMHDGWVSEKKLDAERIEDEIESETGFRMVVESEVLDSWE